MNINDPSIHLLDVNDALQKQWDEYVYQHSEGKLYHLSAWSKLINNVFGHKTFYLYHLSEDNIINGLIPLVQLKSRLFGNYLVSMPYFNYGGVIADNTTIEEKLLGQACTLAKELNASHIEFRDTVLRTPDYPVKTDKISMILTLPNDEAVLWQNLGSKRRSQIKRPLRENPTIHIGTIDLLDDFYQVFAENMRDLGTPVYAKRFFSAMLQTFPQHAHIITIKLNDQPVAAAFLLSFKDILEIPWASTLKKVNNISINMLLYWEVLKFAIQQNYQYFDFGRSSADSGTYRFKKQWGSEIRQLYWHYWLADDGNQPALNPNNPKYRLAIAAWKKMPVALTRLIGPHLVKNLP